MVWMKTILRGLVCLNISSLDSDTVGANYGTFRSWGLEEENKLLGDSLSLVSFWAKYNVLHCEDIGAQLCTALPCTLL